MSPASASDTSPTLLGMLRRDPANQEAWNRFVRRYGPKIHGWCRAWHLQEADAEDVTQGVLLRLAKRMRHFAYDPARSFRGWLRTLTHHALSDFMERQKQTDLGRRDSKVQERLRTVEAREDLAGRLEEEYDLELLEEALARVRLRVPPRKWEVFRLTALEGLSGAEVAERLRMKVATTFVERSKVQAILREEIRRLEAAIDRSGEEHP